MKPEPRELSTISLPVALLARLRAHCVRRGSKPETMLEWAVEGVLRRMLDVFERVYPDPPEKGATTQ